MEQRLARIGRTDERDLRRTFGANDERWTAMSAAFSRTFEILGQIFDARFDVRLQMLGAFVLRDRSQHLAQPVQSLPWVASFAKRGLGSFVLRREVGGHAATVEEKSSGVERLPPGVPVALAWTRVDKGTDVSQEL